MMSFYKPILIFLFKLVLIGIALFISFIILLLVIYKTGQRDRFINLLLKPKRLPLYVDFFRLALVDILNGKEYSIWGVYIFVAKPGNGKTISMTEHIVRVLKEHPNIKVFTNFNFRGQDGVISCWEDIVDAPNDSLICVDELHMLASSGSFQSFPIELLGEITQNRHSRKQFITSTQDYDLISVNFKRVCNYVVLCENVWGLDRLFKNHYFDRGSYESKNFTASMKKCNFTRYFVANDDTYKRYNTLEKISSMVKNLDNGDRNRTVIQLKSLLKSTELLPKESKYINGVVERINLDTQNSELWEQKEREIRDLKEQIKKIQLALGVYVEEIEVV